MSDQKTSHTSPFQLFNTSGFNVPVSYDDFEEIFRHVSTQESVEFNLLETVFVDEKEIQRINKEFLNRDYVTDTISFHYSEDKADEDPIDGTHYLCAQRIAEQAKEFNTEVETEFKRVFIHGILHIIGYNDDTESAKKEMTDLENKYLSEFS